MEEKLAAFFDLAKKMNKKFSIIPMLQGSLGLQLLVDDELNPDDIDVGVPQFLYRFSEKWQDLLTFMQSEGYALTDLHEHSFKKGEIEISFSALDGVEPGAIPSLEVFANIDMMECPIMETDGAIYKLLTLRQYYHVYLCSLEDNYRADKTGNKDQIKVDIIIKALKM